MATHATPSTTRADALAALRRDIASCTHCEPHLPLGARPVIQLSSSARILITGQAPGTKVHRSGKPFSDPSGDRLREWMGVSDAEFYDERRVAIAPVAFCYPGVKGGGDAPPRPECARLWQGRVMEQLGSVRLTLLTGAYAQNHALGRGRVTDRVRGFETFLPRFFPLPHPSWRSRIWMDRNPWFEDEVLPRLRSEIRTILRSRADETPPDDCGSIDWNENL